MSKETRFKSRNWELPTDEQSGRIADWQSVQIAVLMDIRDELQTLNRILSCQNFLALPHRIDAIRRELSGLRRDLRARRKPANKKP